MPDTSKRYDLDKLLNGSAAESEPTDGPPFDLDELLGTNSTDTAEATATETADERGSQSPAPLLELPIPFDTIDTPDFPVESLPEPMAAFVKELSVSTQTPSEMAGILALGVLSTAFQSKYILQVTRDWKEPLSLYLVAVAPPGERKSGVISTLMTPAYAYEKERRQAEAAKVAQNKTERELLQKSLETAKRNAATGKGDTEAETQRALDLSAQLATFQEMHRCRLVVDDTTPEKLVDIMEQQGGSITIASAEGGVFDSMAGRYDRNINIDVYLKGHAGDRISVDRIGRESNDIEHPHLTMILTVQPQIIQGLMRDPTFKGRGLCGRFLYAMCKSKVGYRDPTPSSVSVATETHYYNFVKRILSEGDGGKISLSPEADSVRVGYMVLIEKRLRDEWEHMRDWGGKLVGAMLRIAALLHLSSFPANTPIAADTVERAIAIAEFLAVHAEAAYQTMGGNQAIADAEYLWKRIEGTGKDTLTKTELFRLTRGKFKSAADMEPAIETLIDMNYISREFFAQEGRGRPREIITVTSP